MPKFDGRGPLGYGPDTGRGMGPCMAGFNCRRAMGRGFNRFWGFGPQITEKEEKKILEEEVGVLEDELKTVKDRLSQLKDQK